MPKKPPQPTYMQITNRKEAIKEGVSLYFTGVPCGNGHLAPRYTISGSCRECTVAGVNKTRDMVRDIRRGKKDARISLDPVKFHSSDIIRNMSNTEIGALMRDVVGGKKDVPAGCGLSIETSNGGA